jgi:hypothetical protein
MIRAAIRMLIWLVFLCGVLTGDTSISAETGTLFKVLDERVQSYLEFVRRGPRENHPKLGEEKTADGSFRAKLLEKSCVARVDNANVAIKQEVYLRDYSKAPRSAVGPNWYYEMRMGWELERGIPLSRLISAFDEEHSVLGNGFNQAFRSVIPELKSNFGWKGRVEDLRVYRVDISVGPQFLTTSTFGECINISVELRTPSNSGVLGFQWPFTGAGQIEPAQLKHEQLNVAAPLYKLSEKGPSYSGGAW